MRAIFTLAMAAAVAMPLVAVAQTAPAAHYSTAQTTIGTLVADPAAKAILVKYAPKLMANDQLSQGYSMTLKAVQMYAADELTDANLAAIDAAFAKIPGK